MTAAQSQILRSMMEAVVNEGTASKLKGLAYTAAGKTGSAEFNSSTSDSHAWFTGYAPADDPEICIALCIEKGEWVSYTSDIARKLLLAYFDLPDPKEEAPVKTTPPLGDVQIITPEPGETEETVEE